MEQRGRSGVTVIGTGTAAASVDQVVVNLAVTESGRDAGAAFEAAARTATRVLAVLADDGADARSVRTADLTLGPHTEWRDNREVLLGYQASQRLILHLDGLSRLSRMLTDVATQVGNGVRIEGLQLVPSDPGAALVSAREAAMADARSKAEQYAALAGRSLGAVRSVREQPHFDNGPISAGALRHAKAADSMPIAAGDTSIHASVEVVWSFAD